MKAHVMDFQAYIEERLREISDLDERRFAKEVLLEGLGKAILCMEEKYEALESRVFHEIERQESHYEIGITVIPRERFDPLNGTLFPVLDADLDREGLERSMTDHGQWYLGTVFLKAPREACLELERAGCLRGMATVGGVGYGIRAIAKPAVRYREAIEGLYRIFQDNHVPWKTVNTAYLSQFYDLYLEEPSWTGGVSWEEAKKGLSREDILLRFPLGDGQVFWDWMPLWNIQRLDYNSNCFMIPCDDGIYYEHEFKMGSGEDGYLVQPNRDILEIRHEEGKIVVKSHEDAFEGWKVLRVVQKETERSLHYDEPVLTNHRRDSYISRFGQRSGTLLMTKADLFRRIMELDIRDYIEVVGYEILDGDKGGPAEEGMNWFVNDELFPMETRKALLLRFQERRPGYYLNRSMVRFVISQMQLEIGEYRCVGVLA